MIQLRIHDLSRENNHFAFNIEKHRVFVVKLFYLSSTRDGGHKDGYMKIKALIHSCSKEIHKK